RGRALEADVQNIGIVAAVDVVAVTGEERVVPRPADQRVDVGARIENRRCVRIAVVRKGPLWRYVARVERIVAVAAVDGVGTGISGERVVAAEAGDRVVAGEAADRVVSGSPDERVVP